MILSVRNIFKQYKDKVLLNRVSFDLKSGQKVGIVGSNGSGKSTLINILLGEDAPDNKANDKYEIRVKPDIEIGYIRQNVNYASGETIFNIVKFNTVAEDYEIKSILNKFGFEDYDILVDNLSGGELKKISLAVALLKDTDLLVLDEPTNHLDQKAVDFLEDYLKKYKGAVLLVSHDRYFLSKTIDDILELDDGNLYMYKDNGFDDYLDLKANRIQSKKAELRKNKAEYKKENAWISRGARARGTKSKERIERFENLKKKLKVSRSLDFDLTCIDTRMGTKTIEFKGISKSFKSRVLFEDFSYNFGRYQRVGILGSNGCGKSTLLKIITGEELVDGGIIEVGETVRMGYFSQTLSDVNEELKIIDFIKAKAENIETVNGVVSAEKILENFLFPRSVQYFKISSLSGGEKKRLYLLSVIMERPNVLILDEPTNDFDIDTLLILEEFIENFQGIVVTVSHDRYFLDKVVDDLLVFDEGKIIPFNGNYTEYITFIKDKKKSRKKDIKLKDNKVRREKVKFSYAEKKEFEEIDDDILNIEKEIKNLDLLIVENAKDFFKVTEYVKKRESLEKSLEFKNERWFYLNDLYDKMKHDM